jgi:hypothetical protein
MMMNTLVLWKYPIGYFTIKAKYFKNPTERIILKEEVAL